MISYNNLHVIFFIIFLKVIPGKAGLGAQGKFRVKGANMSDITKITIPEKALSVHFQRNGIEVIPANYFVNLTRIHTIILSHNEIHVIEDYAFENIPFLSQLTLSRNSLTSITRYMFSGLFNLTKLDLSRNHISTIQDGSFFDLRNIKTLELQKNELETISSRVFDRKDLPIVLNLRLRNNPLTCDWRLLGLYDAVHTGKVVLKDGANTYCRYKSKSTLFIDTTWGNMTKTDLQAAGK